MKNTPLLAVCAICAVTALAQNHPTSVNHPTNSYPRPVITEPVDESNLTRLIGNTYPRVRSFVDAGTAPLGLPMERMLLVLKRSVEQQAELKSFLDEQQDSASPNYHKWLTPEEFGRRFGADEQDIQTVSAWLRSHGFQVGRVSKGRTMIEFSGTAGQVQEAFHTAVHKYKRDGEEHWANATDPLIPTALTPLVAGVHSLHNFHKKPYLRVLPQRVPAKYESESQPHVTFPGNPQLHALGPGDLQKIYNAKPLLSSGVTGLGTTIAVVGRSNLFGVQGGFAPPQDVLDFRGLFQVCCGSVSVLIDGADPGDLGGAEEAEATLDTSWAGVIGPDANVILVVSASTNTTDGVDLSELFIIDSNLAPIMSESFGVCEAAVTSAEAAGVAALAEQAAAQGITYLVSSGDSGSAGCDSPSSPQETAGLSVNVLAATPYTVAVGGTMFNEGGQNSKYWSSTNSSTDLGSALSYIPETVWNESCTSAACGNRARLSASGGGKSALYSKPSWQARFGPGDGSRDLPDISLTAAGHDPYLICFEGSCIPDAQGFISFAAVSGTSASAQASAGIMALVAHKTGQRQGQADYVLYRLAGAENFSQCNGSSSSALPPSNCTFNDTTIGNNCVPGESGYPSSCTTYSSAVGYDLATGLGSVNITNLVNNWDNTTFNSTSTALSLNPSQAAITHGSPLTANIIVTGNSGAPTGDVSLLSTLTPPQTINLCTAVNDCTLNPATSTSGSLSVTTNSLPGGSYNLVAHYAGDGTFAPSDSPPVSVNVNPEPSNTSLVVAGGFDPAGSPLPFMTGTYGSPIYLRADVGGSSGFGIPIGIVQFLDNGTLLTAPGQLTPLGQLNRQGTAFTPKGVFTVGTGTRSIVANYLGDGSFSPSTSAATTVTISKATTITTLRLTGSDGTGTDIVATMDTPSRGLDPTGTVTFYSGSTALGPAIAVNPTTGNGAPTQSWSYISSPISGNPTLTATYSGDANYQSSTSAPLVASPDFIVSNNAGAGIVFNTRGMSSSLRITLSPVDSFTGTVTFSCSGFPAESTCTLSPTSQDLTPTTAFANTDLTLRTAAPRVRSLPGVAGLQHWWSAANTLMLVAVFLLASGRRPRGQKHVAFCATTVVLLIGLAGCGGGGGSSGGGGGTHDPGTPVGNYIITVTASSGTLVHSTTLQLVVQ